MILRKEVAKGKIKKVGTLSDFLSEYALQKLGLTKI